jgi:hypothetical protein
MTFDLQKPSYVPDDLDEATTNDDFGPEIEIEIVEDSSEGSLLLGHIRIPLYTDCVGYEPEEPNPYHGTYSEM